MQIALLAFLSLIGLVYLARYFANLPVRLPVVPGTGFGMGDGVLVLILVATYVSTAVNGFGKTVTLSTQLVLYNCLLLVAIILLIIGVMVYRHRDPVRLFGLKWPAWKTALPASLIALIAAYPIIMLAQMIVTRCLGPDARPQEVLQFLIQSKSWWDKAALFAMAAIFAPIAEEVVFRGYIYGVLRQYIGLWPALLIASALFAAIHVHVPALAGLFLFAVLLTLVYERTGSLWAPMVLHATFNSITVIVIILWPEMLP